jgi:hypothetical protein
MSELSNELFRLAPGFGLGWICKLITCSKFEFRARKNGSTWPDLQVDNLFRFSNFAREKTVRLDRIYKSITCSTFRISRAKKRIGFRWRGGESKCLAGDVAVYSVK